MLFQDKHKALRLVAIFLLVFTISFVSANNRIDFSYSTPINYSTIPTVNNSDCWDGHCTYGDGLSSNGNCPAGYVVQNTTSSGVQCVAQSSGGFTTDQNDQLNTTGSPQFNVTTTQNLNVTGTSITTDDITNLQLTFNYAGSYQVAYGYTWTYRVKAFKLVNGQKVWSQNYAEVTQMDDSSESSYNPELTWDAVTGADGYRITRQDDAYGFNFDWIYDTTTNSLVDDGGFTWTQATPNWDSPFTLYSNIISLNGDVTLPQANFPFGLLVRKDTDYGANSFNIMKWGKDEFNLYGGQPMSMDWDMATGYTKFTIGDGTTLQTLNANLVGDNIITGTLTAGGYVQGVISNFATHQGAQDTIGLGGTQTSLQFLLNDWFYSHNPVWGIDGKGFLSRGYFSNGAGNGYYGRNPTALIFDVADPSSLGSEKITDGGFATGAGWDYGTGWSITGGEAVKGINGVGVLNQTSANMQTPVVVGEIYKINFTFTVQTNDGQYQRVFFGGREITKFTTSSSPQYYEQYVRAETTDGFKILPTNGARFKVDNISIKKITEGSLGIAGNIYENGDAYVNGTQAYTGSVTLGLITQENFKNGRLTSTSTSFDKSLLERYNYLSTANPNETLVPISFVFNEEGLAQFENKDEWRNVERIGYLPQDVQKFYPECTFNETHYRKEVETVEFTEPITREEIKEEMMVVSPKDAFEYVRTNASSEYIWNGERAVLVEKEARTTRKMKEGVEFNKTDGKFYLKNVTTISYEVNETRTREEIVEVPTGTYLSYNWKCVDDMIKAKQSEVIDTKVVVAEEFFTKSKVPSANGNFFNLFNSSIYNKTTHFAYNSTKNQLNAETRWVGAEGYLACDRKCTVASKSWDEYKSCKVAC